VSAYEQACHGWRDHDGPSLCESHPYAAWLAVVTPILVALELCVLGMVR
jgi:hypothetical protein